LILLTVLGSLGPWLPGIIQAFGSLTPSPSAQDSQACPGGTHALAIGSIERVDSTCPGSEKGNSPAFVGADGVPNIPLPRTILSNLDTLDGGNGWTQDSAQNLTLHTSQVKMRLLGGADPHDELVAADPQIAQSRMSWSIEASIGNSWVPLGPISSTFQILSGHDCHQSHRFNR